MKKILFVVAFVLIGFTGFSQETDPEFQAKAVELIERTSGGQFEMVIEPLVQRIPEANREAFKTEIKESLNGLYEQLAQIYMENFTEEDIDAILAFYDTPVGTKMLETTPEITQKSMQLGQQWGMKLQPIMAKYAN